MDPARQELLSRPRGSREPGIPAPAASGSSGSGAWACAQAPGGAVRARRPGAGRRDAAGALLAARGRASRLLRHARRPATWAPLPRRSLGVDGAATGVPAGAALTGATFAGGVETAGTGTRGAATAGVVTVGVVTVGVVTVGVVTAGVVTDGVVATGVVTDGTVTDGTVTDGTVTDGTVTAGVVTAGTVTPGTGAAAAFVTLPMTPSARAFGATANSIVPTASAIPHARMRQR